MSVGGNGDPVNGVPSVRGIVWGIKWPFGPPGSTICGVVLDSDRCYPADPKDQSWYNFGLVLSPEQVAAANSCRASEGRPPCPTEPWELI